MMVSGQSRILLVHTGGLGDLVLVSEFTTAVKRALPDCRLMVACRTEIASTLELDPIRPDELIPIPVNPNAWPVSPDDNFEILCPLAERLRDLRADVMVDASLQPTWFTGFAAALVRPAVALSCPRPAESSLRSSPIMERFAPTKWPVTIIPLPPELHERQRYALLLDAIGVPVTGVFPWSLPEKWAAASRDYLRTLHLTERGYVVCFPSGAPSTRVKRWPEENFAKVLARARRKWHLSALLVGEASERQELNRIADAVSGHGNTAHAFCGGPGDIPLLAGLVSMARLYLGNDTGPMHLAAAYDVPGVVIYGGGGEWPRYAPWGRGSHGLLHPLPCFGCSWDCFLNRGLCVESIPVQDVDRALDGAMRDSAAEARTATLGLMDEPLLRIIAEASASYRAAQRDRAERLEVIHRLSAAIRDRDARIAELSHAASERLQVLESTHKEAAVRESWMREMTGVIARHDARVAELQLELERAIKSAPNKTPNENERDNNV